MRPAVCALLLVACGDDGSRTHTDDATPIDAAMIDAVDSPALADRDRLLATLSSDTCALWDSLTPSAQATFLTITARLEGASLLSHAAKLYRVAGGEGATSTDPGSCGGGEYNRLILAIDPELHAKFVAAHDGTPLADIHGNWRDSHDAAGPHAPFTESCETEDGAPRGQVHYFRDPASTEATAPLGRLGVETIVDPYAFEIDQDYDCAHASNPLCDYTFYGPGCAPMTNRSGVAIYGSNYGAIDLAWRPTGC